MAKGLARGESEDVWRALVAMCDLFRQTAVRVADRFSFSCPYEDDRRITGY
ncbi:aminoglycoside 6-adenylyltransferase [Domibacillus iocasae]|uniref:aminoglycoside 6-adenylyltransferase n=1 Tax=Domibacillus iocasae TaxID=1714016 RepID=UPI0009F744D7